MEEVSSFEAFEETIKSPKSRRRLFPRWIKFFIWVFMLFGLMAPLGLILGLMGMSFELSLFGLETTEPISGLGLLLISFFAFKATVAFGMWTGKDWAIKMAKIDAILGIALCVIIMCVLPFITKAFAGEITIRLELLFLIPYLIKLNKIGKEW